MAGSELRTRARNGTVAKTDSGDLKVQIRKMEDQFQLALPRGFEAQQLTRDIMTVIQKTPKLLECKPVSVLGAFMTCAQLGLRPAVLGQAWVLPFAGVAQLVIGYPGYTSLAQRSGQIKSISMREVRDRDEFDVDYGSDTILHKPFLRGPRGDVIGYYSIVRSVTSGTYLEWMSVADAEEHRDKFAMQRVLGTAGKDGYPPKGKVAGPWVDYFDAMAKKTVLIGALRLAPRDTEIQRGLDVDGTVRMDLSPMVDPVDVSDMPEVTGPSVDPEIGYDPTVEDAFSGDQK